MAVCSVFLIAAGIGIAALFLSGRPVPRHVFILNMWAELSQRLGEPERLVEQRMRTAA